MEIVRVFEDAGKSGLNEIERGRQTNEQGTGEPVMRQARGSPTLLRATFLPKHRLRHTSETNAAVVTIPASPISAKALAQRPALRPCFSKRFAR